MFRFVIALERLELAYHYFELFPLLPYLLAKSNVALLHELLVVITDLIDAPIYIFSNDPVKELELRYLLICCRCSPGRHLKVMILVRRSSLFRK